MILQLQNSDKNRVTLFNLTFTTSGNYKCEVSTEAPNFETVAQNSNMTVMGKWPRDDACVMYVKIFSLVLCRHIAPLSVLSDLLPTRFRCRGFFYCTLSHASRHDALRRDPSRTYTMSIIQRHLRGCADTSLAPAGRKQSTATKLGIYSTYSPTKLNTLLSPLL